MEFLPKLALRNRAFIALLCLVVSVLGGYAVTTLRQELIPPVELPAVRILAVTPGATSEQMAAQVADPIERQLRLIEQVESTSSRSTSSATSLLMELEYGSDVYRAALQADVALNALEAAFPEGTQTRVFSGGSGQIPAIIMSVASDLPVDVLSARLDSVVIPELNKINGVSTTEAFGAPDPIVRLTLDEAEMTRLGVSESDIITALDASGLTLPAGSVVDGTNQLDVTVGRPSSSIDDVAAIAVLPGGGISPEVIHLGDVAVVERAVAEATSASRTNGRESVTLLVTPTTTGNVVQISEDVNQRLAALAESVGGDTEFIPVFDQAPFITSSIESLGQEGLYGLVFAVLVILVFLTALRPTLIAAVSIPLTVLFAFVGMLVSGTTLNTLAIAGLTLSIGRMVDDSIVVIENITRHLGYRKTKGRAILDATTEVAGAVTSSAIVSVLTFSPLLLVSGLAGELFRPFALTVVLAQAASLLVGLTIIPVLAFWLMRTRPAAADTREAADELAEQREERYWLNRIYTPPLHWALGHRWLALLLAGMVFGGSLALLPLLKVNLLDDAGQNIVIVEQELPAGTNLAESLRQAERVEGLLAGIDGVQTVQTTAGGSDFMQASPGDITYSITTDIDADQQALQQIIEDELTALPDAGTIEVVDLTAFGSSTVDVRVIAPDDESLAAANELVLQAVAGVDGISSAESNFTATQPTVQITVNRDAAARRGLSEEQVVAMIAARTADRGVASITLEGIEMQVFIASQGDVETLDDIRELVLLGTPIAELATVEVVDVVPTVVTFDAVRTVTVSGTPASSEDVGNVSLAVQDAVESADLPDGTVTEMAGISEDIRTSFTQLGVAILAAILITYVVLVWIFKSLVQPLILLVAIPFAVTGSIVSMMLTGTSLGLPALIGVLMLVGIVVTNSIVLIDLVNQYRRRGMDLQRALSLGSRRRVRPIMMTAAATVCALVPASLGLSGQDSFVTGPLAAVTIGGLATSTLMTLVVVPVLYSLVESRRETGEDAFEAQISGVPAARRAEG